MGLSAVDDAVGKEPPMEKDAFWDDVHTRTALRLRDTEYADFGKQNATRTKKSVKKLQKTIRWKLFQKGRTGVNPTMKEVL